MCVLGGGAFLISSLTVEADRAVSKHNLGHGVCTLKLDSLTVDFLCVKGMLQSILDGIQNAIVPDVMC